jgi:hypothetical protein
MISIEEENIYPKKDDAEILFNFYPKFKGLLKAAKLSCLFFIHYRFNLKVLVNEEIDYIFLDCIGRCFKY